MSTPRHRDRLANLALGARAIAGLLLVVVVGVGALGAVMTVRQPATSPAVLGTGADSPAAASALPRQAASTVAADALPIMEVPQARFAAQDRMVREFGVRCMIEGEADAFPLPDAAADLDRAITAANVGDSGWVVKDQVWLGSPETAAKAFGASTLYADGESFWLFFAESDLPRARELHQAVSTSGRTTWRPLDQITAIPCDSEAAASE